MENLKEYKVFESDGEDGVERLSALIEYNRDAIIKFMDDRSMESDIVDVSEPDEFVVEYWPKSLNGAISKKISYYIDDLCKILSRELRVGVDWEFSPNGNSQRLIFTLDNEIFIEYYDSIIKYIKTKERIKY